MRPAGNEMSMTIECCPSTGLLQGTHYVALSTPGRAQLYGHRSTCLQDRVACSLKHMMRWCLQCLSQQAYLCIDGNAALLCQQDCCCAVAIANGQVQRAVLLIHCMVDISSSSNQQSQGLSVIALYCKNQSCPASSGKILTTLVFTP